MKMKRSGLWMTKESFSPTTKVKRYPHDQGSAEDIGLLSVHEWREDILSSTKLPFNVQEARCKGKRSIAPSV
jgi:hypothetical protein